STLEQSTGSHLGAGSLVVGVRGKGLAVDQCSHVVQTNDEAACSEELKRVGDSTVESSGFLGLLSIEESLGVGVDALLEDGIVETVLA
ncbi:hypothetical protein PENTCL1PPCAC_2398, partial [Pristionchus entomophagus]